MKMKIGREQCDETDALPRKATVLQGVPGESMFVDGRRSPRPEDQLNQPGSRRTAVARSAAVGTRGGRVVAVVIGRRTGRSGLHPLAHRDRFG